jgi:hypothetical protein
MPGLAANKPPIDQSIRAVFFGSSNGLIAPEQKRKRGGLLSSELGRL